nr:hypothetical protein [Tanacetum cinerariifolium]
RLQLSTPRPRCKVEESSAAIDMVNMRVSYQVDVRSRKSSEFYSRHHDAQKDRAAVRAKIEARVAVLETQARRHKWQRQTADDFAVQHIMRTQTLEAGARIDTLEDTGVALTWWNSHVKTVTLEVAQALPKSKESDRVEKYISGLPDTIHDSVKAARPKTMQEAIEFATELMDKRIRHVVENKRKFEGTYGNNQN